MEVMKKLGFLALAATMISTNVWSYGTGWSAYPLMTDKKIISAEFSGITSEGGGIGLQTRYTQKINSRTTIDAGVGMAGGERAGRIFTGADLELYPDYGGQPRISLKATLVNTKEFAVRRNNIGLTPIISKGLSFWGEEAFPYISLPIAISLDGDTQSYETVMSANLGVNGNLPFEGYRHLTGSLEAKVSLKDSFTAIFMGVSYPLQ